MQMKIKGCSKERYLLVIGAQGAVCCLKPNTVNVQVPLWMKKCLQ